MTVNRFDVGILGSGFGGSLLAAILARQGMKVLLLDQETHPRFAIGESSTPAADLILDELARTYDLPELLPLCRFGTWREKHPELLCGCKRGFSYLGYDRDGKLQPTPEHINELLVAANDSREMADTQWYRPDVDAFFSDVARKRGVTFVEGVESLWIEKNREHHWKISVTLAGLEETFEPEFVIDATGASGFLIEMMGNISSYESLKTHSSAIFSHWEGVASLESVLREEGFAIDDYPYPIEQSVIHHLFPDGWFWQIPFEGKLTSLGYVAIGELSESQQPEDRWDYLVARSPLMQRLMASARLAALPGKMYQSGPMQRLASHIVGDDWAALPFTAGFIDPLHSTGIAQTLFGVGQLAEILLSHRDRLQRLNQYERGLRNQFHLIDLFVAGCYRGLPRFDRFRDWSMIYFAAATTFEKRFRSDGFSASFLCANDPEFLRTVNTLWEELGTDSGADWTTTIRKAIEPWNNVGLFLPQKHNLYFRTAADKS